MPAGGQGAVGIEIRSADTRVHALLQPLHDEPTALCVRAERALNTHLQGGCQVPIACFAELSADRTQLLLRGLVGEPDGSVLLHARAEGPSSAPEALGIAVAEDLLRQGAAQILERVYAGE